LLLGEQGQESNLDAIELGLQSSTDIIREGSIIAYCQVMKEQAFERLEDWIRSKDGTTRTAALIGCGRSCGEQGMDLAVPIIQAMIDEGEAEDCSSAAQLIGRMGNPNYGFILEQLLAHTDEFVLEAAVEASGQIKNAKLVPRLLELYMHLSLREHVHDALEAMPRETVPEIVEFLGNRTYDQEARARLVDVLSTIGGEEAQNALWDMFDPDLPLIMRKAAGSSLQKLAENNELRPLDPDQLERRGKATLSRIELLNRSCNEIGDKDEFSSSSLGEQARMEIGCLFHLLSLQFDTDKIVKISTNLFSYNAVQRANAIALLDELLPQSLAPIVKILESLVEQQITKGNGLSIDTANELIKCEVWPKVLAAHHFNGSDSGAYESLSEGEKRIYDLIDVVEALKAVAIFQDVPGNHMVALAMVTQKLNVPLGHVLFSEGDIGDALFLVATGEISVQVSGSEVAKLGAGECFGEIALVDGLPRSATCVASKDSELLVLSDQDFLAFMHGQGSIALGILQTLTQRLRHQMESSH
jgi:HEAT repeat protein